MPAPTTAQWIEIALSGELVVDIGQIDKATARELNRLVKAGKLARCRGFWSSMLVGPLKTIWAAPHALWAAGQFDSIREASDEFYAALEEAQRHRDEAQASLAA